jgi:hypothetical protein
MPRHRVNIVRWPSFVFTTACIAAIIVFGTIVAWGTDRAGCHAYALTLSGFKHDTATKSCPSCA